MTMTTVDAGPIYTVQVDDLDRIAVEFERRRYRWQYSTAQANAVRPEFRSWGTALFEAALRGIDLQPLLFRILACAEHEDVVQAAKLRALEWLPLRRLTRADVHSLTLRNLYYLHHHPEEARRLRKKDEIGYYLGTVTFLAVVLTAWDVGTAGGSARTAARFILPTAEDTEDE